MTRRIRNEEDGAVLVMALIFLTVAAILTAALLSFADTDFRTTVNVRSQGKDLYGAEAAIEAAINRYRHHPGCTGLPASPTVDGVTATVTCQEGVTSSGSPSNAPKLAVIARATGSEKGIQLASGAFTAVRGGVYSNTTIDVPGGSQLYAKSPDRVVTRDGCTGAGDVGPVSCEVVASYPEGSDPNYAKLPATAPTPFISAPACPATEPVVFQPGTYNDRAALKNLMDTCARRTYHFPAAGGIGSPGVYYFDFPDDTVWTIPNGFTVVGGTLPAGVTGATVSTKPAGERCDEDAEGVQFLFGGASRIFVQGAMELCAPYSDPTSTVPRVAIYGVKTSDVVPPAPVAQTVTLNPSSTTPAGTPFQPAGGARTPNDGQVAVAPVPVDQTSSITTSGFDLSAIPNTAVINSAVLVLRHSENESPSSASPNFNKLNLEATATSGTAQSIVRTNACGSTPNCSKTLTMGTTMRNEPSTSWTLPAAFNLKTVLSAMTVTYKAVSSGSAYAASLDGVSLAVTYTEPAVVVPLFRAQSGCIKVAPYAQPSQPDMPIAATSPCALITTAGSNASLAVKGTTYAPDAALDIQLTGASYQVFGRGIIVRSLRSNVTSSTDCTVPPADTDVACFPFQLPGSVTTTGDVLFVAKVDGRTRLRALVRFNGTSSPQVKSWSVVNEP